MSYMPKIRMSELEKHSLRTETIHIAIKISVNKCVIAYRPHTTPCLLQQLPVMIVFLLCGGSHTEIFTLPHLFAH